MAWDREKERKAGKAMGIGTGIFALGFSIFWCCMAAAMGAWFMLIFGLPFAGFMAYRLAFMVKKSKAEVQKEPWEQPDKSQSSYETTTSFHRDGFCPYCGEKMEDQFVFCPKCGRRR